jgi:hypothetical protein
MLQPEPVGPVRRVVLDKPGIGEGADEVESRRLREAGS